MRRSLAVVAIAILGLAACGEEDGFSSNKPSAREVIDEGQWVSTETPDGDPVWCLVFFEDGAYTSWSVFTCVPRSER